MRCGEVGHNEWGGVAFSFGDDAIDGEALVFLGLVCHRKGACAFAVIFVDRCGEVTKAE
tara:strand:- start:35 stop:211 length:177 start_codon:yes stop_codon:yes gene_type:complete